MAKASSRVVDFREAFEPGDDDRPVNDKGQLMTAKQVRARVRRKMSKGQKISDEEFEAWAGKPIDEWDIEELARGRPRDASGGFRGAPPRYVPRAVHERIGDRFKLMMRDQMNISSVTALGVISNLLNNEEYDLKGKPIVAANTKLDAAKWLVEHVIGKPVQPTQTDVSVKLQAVLGSVMANPVLDDGHPDMVALPRGYTAGHYGERGEVVDAEVVDDYDDD